MEIPAKRGSNPPQIGKNPRFRRKLVEIFAAQPCPIVLVFPKMQSPKNDVLSQLALMRSELETERAEILTRLAGINAALGQPTHRTVSRAAGGQPVKARKVYRRAPGSLEELIVDVTTAAPLSAPEILEAVSRAGYVTTAPEPLKVITAVLARSKQLQKVGRGKFGPAKAK